MTCNMMIALLETYRTGEPLNTGVGTIKDDIKRLSALNLIEQDGNGQYNCTPLGTEKIEAVLSLMTPIRVIHRPASGKRPHYARRSNKL